MQKQYNTDLLPSDFLLQWFSRKYWDYQNETIFVKYYKSYLKQFPQYTRNSYDLRLKPVIDIVNKYNKDINLLEIGSGCGTEALYFSMLGCSVTGVEFQKQMVDVALKRKYILEDKLNNALDCNFINQSILDYDKDRKYDIIWMEETFHHLEPRELIIDKVHSLLKHGGYLIISEPNYLNMLIQIKYFMARGFRTTYTAYDDSGRKHLIGHERILRAKKLARHMEKRNINIINIEYIRLLPNIFPDNNIYRSIDEQFNKIIPPFIKKYFAIQYNYVGKLNN